MRRKMIVLLVLIVLSSVFTFGCIINSKMGKAPAGERLDRLKKSEHYKDGAFCNVEVTPHSALGDSSLSTAYKMMFGKYPGSKPEQKIPIVHTNLKTFHVEKDVIVWFGHSSYYLQIQGKRFLIDPVFSGHASPVPFSVKAFKGTDEFNVDDMPEIDFLIITHDHYDHLDAKTVKGLKKKVKKVICGLGVGSHFEYWGYKKDIIIEKDWDEQVDLGDQMTLFVLTARHFSGRSFQHNNTLWVSFLLETPKQKIFLGGDSGYDKHFEAIGKRFGPIDLAILENGQYNMAWHAIHCLPEETLKAARDLGARYLLPVHSCKFSISTHAWKEPLSELVRINTNYHIPLVTPKIGEPVYLDQLDKPWEEWWKTLK